VTPAAKKVAVQLLQEEHGYSQRRACHTIQCNRTTVRHISKRQEDVLLRTRLRDLAEKKKSWGYRMLGGALRLEGWSLNHKRAYRIYKEEKLDLRPKHRKHRKRLKSQKRGRPEASKAINEVWTMDFTRDRLSDGRPFRTLNVIDIFTRRCLGIEVDTSLSSERVVRVLERLIQQFGSPKLLQIDNGPEFRGKKLDIWAKKNGVELHFIDPGKPTQNGHIESFNGRFGKNASIKNGSQASKKPDCSLSSGASTTTRSGPIPAWVTYRPMFGCKNNELSRFNWTNVGGCRTTWSSCG
jgi:putative transposase